MDKEISIVIFENQKSQFITIAENIEKLGNGKIRMYPPCDDYQNENVKWEYEEFTDHVRIALNRRYKDERRNSSKNYLINYIFDKHADILVIDQKLVGWHKSDDGIDLALTFREAKIGIPILFLSRTPLNIELDKKFAGYFDLRQKYDKVAEPKLWVEKGYAGGALLDYFYFERNVIDKINQLAYNYNLLESTSSYLIKINEILDCFDDDQDINSYKQIAYFRDIIEKGEVKVNKELNELIDSLGEDKNLKRIAQKLENYLIK